MKDLKSQIIQLVSHLPIISKAFYFNNFDDSTQGFRVNLSNTDFLEIRYPLEDRDIFSYLHISHYRATVYDCKLHKTNIITGKSVLIETGDLDIDFYKKLLNQFINR